ncbi:FtsX-like permease family protein [Actinoplanes couchii]|uniref:Membrane protein n=1 Tax=Actinoplanes couchii TaxID=403638 RepID=A0ABQ3XT25_9ACTN|nr:FtsX-like permease family protein [Actinoplanes couchii]MDR6318545.1 hypothetical protein [Actinoplanes couchii]GID61522.1 membrane protein [Actinoplanes couchii]
MRQLLTEIGLGMRLAFTGGRRGWSRTLMSAVGVALGTTVLLLGASVPSMLADRGARLDSRSVFNPQQQELPPGDTVLVAEIDSAWQDVDLLGVLLWPESPAAPLPPGIPAFPGDGEMYVSPALAGALAGPGAEVLRGQLPYRAVGTITAAGLAGPQEYAYYAGRADLTERVGVHASRLARFGDIPEAEPADTSTYLILAVLITTLLLPVAIFLGAALRFGADARDRRLAAIRLAGADSRVTRRIAVAESLVPAIAGLILGSGLFLLARSVAGQISLFEISVFPADVRPVPLFAALTVLIVLALAAVMTLHGLRGVTIEPLGVFRRSLVWRGRLWWRLILPVLGLALVSPVFLSSGRVSQEIVMLGMILLILGVVPLVPYLIPLVARISPGGPVSWQLASRQLRQNPLASTRAVTGIVVGVAGVVALNSVFAAINVRPDVRDHPADPDASIIGTTDATPAAMARLNTTFQTIAGVRATTDAEYMILDPTTGWGIGNVYVGDCAALDVIADMDGCADGDTFTVGTPPKKLPLENDETINLPKKPRPAVLTGSFAQNIGTAVLLTPAATPAALSRVTPGFVTTRLRLDGVTATETGGNIRGVAAGIDPFLMVTVFVPEGDKFAVFRTALNLGATVILLLIGLGLLLDVADRLHDRRRLIGALAAIGASRTTIIVSSAAQAVVPVVAGLFLAVGTGAIVGTVLMRMDDIPISFSPGPLLTPVAGGLALIIGCTVAVLLPAARRLTSTEQLRQE